MVGSSSTNVRSPGSPRRRAGGSGGRLSAGPSSSLMASLPGQASPTSSSTGRVATPRGRPLRPSRSSTSSPEKAPLRASASALSGKPSPSSSGRSPSSSARAVALEAEVAALRTQLSEQAEGHQSDMSALRAEQALRRAALEDALRAESAEAERRLCLQFAEEATAFKVQADISLQQAAAQSRAAMRREMEVLRCQVEGLRGVVLICGPPCAGKTEYAQVMAAQLNVTHVSLPLLLDDEEVTNGNRAAAEQRRLLFGEYEEERRQRSAGPRDGSSLSTAEIVRRLVGAGVAADNSLLLLECPSHSPVLSRLLMQLTPLLVVLVSANDAVCTHRMQRRARAAGQPVPLAVNAATLLHEFRASDERVARAFGARYPGQLCVLDRRVTLEEAPAVLAAAVAQAVRAGRWLGGVAACEPPLLVVGAEAETEASAAPVATADASVGGMNSVHPPPALQQDWQQRWQMNGGSCTLQRAALNPFHRPAAVRPARVQPMPRHRLLWACARRPTGGTGAFSQQRHPRSQPHFAPSAASRQSGLLQPCPALRCNSLLRPP